MLQQSVESQTLVLYITFMFQLQTDLRFLSNCDTDVDIGCADQQDNIPFNSAHLIGSQYSAKCNCKHTQQCSSPNMAKDIQLPTICSEYKKFKNQIGI